MKHCSSVLKGSAGTLPSLFAFNLKAGLADQMAL